MVPQAKLTVFSKQTEYDQAKKNFNSLIPVIHLHDMQNNNDQPLPTTNRKQQPSRNVSVAEKETNKRKKKEKKSVTKLRVGIVFSLKGNQTPRTPDTDGKRQKKKETGKTHKSKQCGK
jgi:hypothetical protein